MSWVDDLGIRHFDDGSDGGDGGDGSPSSWSSWVSSPAYQQYTEQNQTPVAESYAVPSTPIPVTTDVSTTGDPVRDMLYDSQGYGEMPTLATPAAPAAENPFAYMYQTQPAPVNVAQLAGVMGGNNMYDSALNERMNKMAWTSGDGSIVRDRFGVPLLSGAGAELVSSGQAHWDNNPNSPTYRSWVAGKRDNGTPGYVDAKGNFQYGTSQAGGMTYDQLKSMQANGYGSMDLTDTQTVDQALASMEADKFITKYAAPAFKMMIPGAGIAEQAARGLAGLQAGTTTPGNLATGVLTGVVANKMGVSPGVLTDMLNLNLQDAATKYATGHVVKEVSSELAAQSGLPQPFVSQVLSELGATRSFGDAIREFVGKFIPNMNAGTTSGIAKALDRAAGTTGPASGNTGIPSYNATGNYGALPYGNGMSTGAQLGSGLASLLRSGQRGR